MVRRWEDLYLWDRAQPPELCPHIEASGIVVNRRVANQVGRIIDSLDLPQAAPDEASDEKVKPWVRLIEDMLLDSQLAAPLIRAILAAWIPERHHGEMKSFRKTIPQPPPEPEQQTFHKFPELPPELRIRIWELAAAEPPHVLRWKLWHPPLQVRGRLPDVAKACKEARDVVTSRAGNFRPARPAWLRAAPEGSKMREWTSSDALVLLRQTLDWHSHFSCSLWRDARDWGVDFVQARKTVGVYYREFVRFADHWGAYRLLRHSQKLDTLVVIVAEKVVHVAGGAKIPEGELQSHYNRYVTQLDKLVMFDEVDEIRRLDALWNEIGPQSYWLSRYDYWEWSEVSQWDSTSLPGGLKCLNCEMQRWRDEGEAHIRSAWLRMVATTEPGHRTDPDIFPDGVEPNMDHRWVQEEVRKMPKIKPAMIFQIKGPSS